MAVLPIKRMMICALRKDRKSILEMLQRLGTVDVEQGPEGDGVFGYIDMSSQSAQFVKHSEAADQALAVLDAIEPENKGLLSMLDGKKTLTSEEYTEEVTSRENITNMVYAILKSDKRIAELKAEIPKLEMQITTLEPWKNLDIPLSSGGTRTVTTLAGTVSGEMTLSQIYEAISSYAPELTGYDGEVISSSPEQTCLFFVVKRGEEAKLEEALRSIEFAKAPTSLQDPSSEIRSLEEKIKKDQDEIEVEKEAIRLLAPNRDKIKFLRDDYAMRADKYNVISELSQSKRTFVLTGYVPAEDVPELEKKLAAYDAEVEFYDPEEGEDVPVKLKNNGFASPVESVVESYSMPSKGEWDPSVIMAPFYYICFGLMLSDAAYGLIMTIVCGVLLATKKDMGEGLKKFLKMFLFCGISTTFWGFMFGSFFGDAVNVIATTFFNRPDIRLAPLWFEPVNKPMKMLVFAFLVGIIHLFTGLGIKMVSSIKQGRIKDAIYDVVFWYMLVGGAIVYLLTMPMITEMLGLTFQLPAGVGKVAAIAAGIGAVGIILTAGRESKNWFKRILKGLYGVYGVTGYLSDILSYSRLLALGLATSVISTVFNKMGSMLGNSIPGVILFIIVFVIGHALNLAINALGAYVHTNRLQYVEFFGKFYEGGGKKLEPFKENTKYYQIKEAE